MACLPFAGELVRGLAAAPRVWWGVVYLGVVPTGIAFSTWAYALGALGWLLLGEVPLPLAVVGGAVSLVGVVLARRPACQPGADRSRAAG